MKNRINILQKGYRFILVGAFSTTINYSIFSLLYKVMSIYYIFSSVLGYLTGLSVGYLLNKNWTYIAQIDKSKSYIYSYMFMQGRYKSVYTVSVRGCMLVLGVCGARAHTHNTHRLTSLVILDQDMQYQEVRRLVLLVCVCLFARANKQTSTNRPPTTVHLLVLK